MLQAMYNGVSAISATQEDMNIIGNDIANVNTTAYKDENVTFADQLSQTLQGASQRHRHPRRHQPDPDRHRCPQVASISAKPPARAACCLHPAPPTWRSRATATSCSRTPAAALSYTRDGHFRRGQLRQPRRRQHRRVRARLAGERPGGHRYQLAESPTPPRYRSPSARPRR